MKKVIIIGGGISGLSCAIYLSRYGVPTTVFKNYSNGSLEETPYIENYPGIPNISGIELLSNMEEQAVSFGTEIFENKVIEILEDKVIIDDNQSFNYDILVIATGRSYKKLDINNIERFKNIHYCATCDGAFYKDKNVIVVGGGNTALTDAITLSNYAKSVTILIRKNQFKADNSLVNKIINIKNINVKFETQITDFKENGVILNNNDFIEVDGIFVAIGSVPNNELLKNIINKDNVYITGDVNGEYHQAIIAAGNGAITACKIYEKYFLKY